MMSYDYDSVSDKDAISFTTTANHKYLLLAKSSAAYSLFSDPNLNKDLVEFSLLLWPDGTDSSGYAAIRREHRDEGERVGLTLFTIINEWYNRSENLQKIGVMVFFNDGNKGGAIRSRYFALLHHKYGRKAFYMKQIRLKIDPSDTEGEYCCLFHRSDHPLAAQIQQAIEANIVDGAVSPK